MLRRLRRAFSDRMARRALESDREVRRRAARDPAFRAHLERYEADARPVLEALADAGLRVKRLPDLNNRDVDYRAQIPVLIEWLPRTTYPPVKETIARALTVREARPAAAPALLDALRRTDGGDGLLQQALGGALAITADASYFDAIAELIEDPATGSARSALIELYLGRFPDRREQAIAILRRRLTDDDLGRYALKPLAKLRAVEARVEMERFLNHEQDWVRRDAERALAKLRPRR
jgi:HEAT repeat protein